MQIIGIDSQPCERLTGLFACQRRKEPLFSECDRFAVIASRCLVNSRALLRQRQRQGRPLEPAQERTCLAVESTGADHG